MKPDVNAFALVIVAAVLVTITLGIALYGMEMSNLNAEAIRKLSARIEVLEARR